jgi:hypothetical protein
MFTNIQLLEVANFASDLLQSYCTTKHVSYTYMVLRQLK